MECGNLQCCFPAGLSVWNKDRIKSLKGDDVQTFKAAIDAMAHGSAKAQQLKTGISTVDRLVASEYTLYVLVDDGCKAVLGIIKVGRKHLYLTDPSGIMIQSDPLCVMDFYVHESCQRKGVGLKLFKLALQHEGVRAHHMAYDRPSPKLIAFLKNHFNLFTSTVQHNHFLVFDEYFNDPGHKTENRRVSAY